jgi:hypothetical protein
MSRTKVRVALAIALAATLVAAFRAPAQDDDAVALSPRARAMKVNPSSVAPRLEPTTRTERSHAADDLDVLEIRSRDMNDNAETESAGVFAATQWTPASAVVKASVSAEPEPAPPPQAPPLPFRVMGRYVDGGAVVVFLQHNDRNLAVRAGDTIDDQYKVESLDGGTLTLLYTPLNQKQTLEIGVAN